jgi:hypothetical protein
MISCSFVYIFNPFREFETLKDNLYITSYHINQINIYGRYQKIINLEVDNYHCLVKETFYTSF